MSGPELERETFRDADGNVLEGIVWPEAKLPPLVETGDDHLHPLDDPADVIWLRRSDPRRIDLEERS